MTFFVVVKDITRVYDITYRQITHFHTESESVEWCKSNNYKYHIFRSDEEMCKFIAAAKKNLRKSAEEKRKFKEDIRYNLSW